MRDKVLILNAKRKDLELKRSELLRESEEISKELELATITQKLIQDTAQLTLESISVRVNKIVTNAIKAVLPEPYEFFLNFDIKYGNISCSMYLERDGKQFYLKEQNGDGLVDCVALALRIAVLCLDKRKLRRVLILDEPCGAVSVNYQQTLGSMLKQLSDMLDLQIIMVASHGSNMQIPEAKVFDSASFCEGAKL
jgi:hypothetical protein